MNRTIRRTLGAFVLAGAVAATMIPGAANAATTTVHGRNAPNYSFGSAAWVASAQGQTIDNHSLQGRAAVQETAGVQRVRIYRVNTQMLRNGAWVNVQTNETDAVSDATRAYAVSTTPATPYCQHSSSGQRTYRVLNTFGVRTPTGVILKSQYSFPFTAPALVTDPACQTPTPPPAPPKADLRIDVQGDGTQLHEENQDLIVWVANDGPGTAGNATAVIDLDDNAGLVVDDHDPRATLRASSSDLNDYTVNLGVFSAGESESIWFDVDADLVGSTAVAAFVDGSVEPSPHDADSLAVNVVKAADLSLTTTVSPGSINSGDSVTYTLAVHNAGPDVAREVVIDNNWPAALASNLQVTGAVNWSLNSDDRLVINLGNLASGGTDTVTVTASASSDSPTTVTNTASVDDSADVYDRDSNDRTDSATFTIS